jgi:hypothetical protein
VIIFAPLPIRKKTTNDLVGLSVGSWACEEIELLGENSPLQHKSLVSSQPPPFITALSFHHSTLLSSQHSPLITTLSAHHNPLLSSHAPIPSFKF